MERVGKNQAYTESREMQGDDIQIIAIITGNILLRNRL